MTSRVGCKARVFQVEYTGEGKYRGAMIRVGSPPYDPNPDSENGKFFAATPSITMNLGIVSESAAQFFEENTDYYVYFEKAPQT